MARNIAQEVMFSARVGGMLARVAFDEAQFIGEHECLAILGQAHAPILAKRVDGHREKAKLHVWAPRYLMACGLMGEPVPPGMTSGAPQKKNS